MPASPQLYKQLFHHNQQRNRNKLGAGMQVLPDLPNNDLHWNIQAAMKNKMYCAVVPIKGD